MKVLFRTSAAVVLVGLIGHCNGFAPIAEMRKNGPTLAFPSQTMTTKSISRQSELSAVFPPDAATTTELLTSSSSILTSMADEDSKMQLMKAILIALFIGGGMIPALIGGNIAMMKTLKGESVKNQDEITGDPETTLDPTIQDPSNLPLRKYVASSGATGPELPGTALLFANEAIPLADIIAILGRINGVESVADWKNLPSAKRRTEYATTPPYWLPRITYKVNIRKAPWLGWPLDKTTGEPLGGEELKAAEEKRISQSNAVIGDSALDAIWDTWAQGSGITTPDKVAKTLASYKKGSAVDLQELTNAAVRGRFLTGLAAFTFVMIQVVGLGTIFVAPILRIFFNVDIGFGTLGTCDPTKCIDLNIMN